MSDVGSGPHRAPLDGSTASPAAGDAGSNDAIDDAAPARRTKARVQCPFPGCASTFAKLAHLRRHRTRHTKGQDHACPQCHRRFSRPDSRDRHVSKLHPELALLLAKGRGRDEHPQLDTINVDRSRRQTRESSPPFLPSPGMNSLWPPPPPPPPQAGAVTTADTTAIALNSASLRSPPSHSLSRVSPEPGSCALASPSMSLDQTMGASLPRQNLPTSRSFELGTTDQDLTSPPSLSSFDLLSEVASSRLLGSSDQSFHAVPPTTELFDGDPSLQRTNHQYSHSCTPAGEPLPRPEPMLSGESEPCNVFNSHPHSTRRSRDEFQASQSMPLELDLFINSMLTNSSAPSPTPLNQILQDGFAMPSSLHSHFAFHDPSDRSDRLQSGIQADKAQDLRADGDPSATPDTRAGSTAASNPSPMNSLRSHEGSFTSASRTFMTSPTSVPDLAEGAASNLGDLKENAQRFVSDLQIPVEPRPGLAAACLWLFQRYCHLPSSFLGLTDPYHPMHRTYRQAILLHMIGIGSLWCAEKESRRWGKAILFFSGAFISSKGMRRVKSHSDQQALAVLLLLAQQYLIMSGDSEVHDKIGWLWLYTQSLANERRSYTLLSSTPKGNTRGACQPQEDEMRTIRHPTSYSSLSDFEAVLGTEVYRARLRLQPDLLVAAWQHWKHMEDRVRTVWGLYICDSQQTSWLDLMPLMQASVRKDTVEAATHNFAEPSDPEGWLTLFEREIPTRRVINTLLPAFFKRFVSPAALQAEDSAPCIIELMASACPLMRLVYLESIYASWWSTCHDRLSRSSDYWSASDSVSRDSNYAATYQSLHALARWRAAYTLGAPVGESTFAPIIRWHGIHLEMVLQHIDLLACVKEVLDYGRSDTRDSQHSAGATMPPGHRGSTPQTDPAGTIQHPLSTSSGSGSFAKLCTFVTSESGRRALYHAGKIFQAFASTQRDCAFPVHVCSSLFEALVVMTSTALVMSPVFRAQKAQSRSSGEVSCDQAEEPSAHQGHVGMMQPRFELVSRRDSGMWEWAQLGLRGCVPDDYRSSHWQSFNGSQGMRDWEHDWALQANDDTARSHWHNEGQARHPASASPCRQRAFSPEKASPLRQWVCFGPTELATIHGLSISNCVAALGDLLSCIEGAKLRWCLAEDRKHWVSAAIDCMSKPEARPQRR